MRRAVVLLMVWAVAAAGAWAAPGQFEPHIAYVFPAGGQQGTTFRIEVGGQFLRGVNSVRVSGEGVRASFVYSMRPVSPMQMQLVQYRLAELRRQRWGGGPGMPAGAAAKQDGAVGQKFDGVQWPDIPILSELERKTPDEARRVARQLVEAFAKQRVSPQMAETAYLDVTIDARAAPGNREIRLGYGGGGLTNPLCFQVGRLPEVREPEPVAPRTRMPGTAGKKGGRMATAFANLPEPPQPVLDPPVVLNGQVLEGEVDRFPLRGRKGQHLVIRTEARSLIPYLADAVPGWFQAVVALYDPKGKEVAYADDYRFDPDPVLYYEIPEDGEYRLEIRDSIYRGRDDFVYRISVAEQPFITRLFPLGGRAGTAAVASISGWNLPRNQLTLATEPGPESIRRTVLRLDAGVSNEVTYAVDTLPEQNEAEPNNSGKDAQRIALPALVNGRISRPGDVDVFRIEGHAGDEVVAEVYARRLGSPLDSLLQIFSATGQRIGINDDTVDPEQGLLTHHADSYVRVKLPKEGAYFVRLSDSESHGDDAYAYRLHLRPRQPDFGLRVTPSCLTPSGTGIALLTVHAVRKDGFDGDIELALKDAPAGFRLSGNRIPHGRDCVRMTLSVPWMRPNQAGQPIVLKLEARADLGGGGIVTRPVIPADDLMQAFAYRHLVPAQALILTGGGRRAAGIELADASPVRLPAGGSAPVRVKAPLGQMLQSIRLQLSDAPKGVTLQDVRTVAGSVSFSLKAEAATAQVGSADNVIIEAFSEVTDGQQGDKGARRTRRFSLGVFPAVPVEIVPR